MTPIDADVSADDRHISGSTTAVVCRYVERIAGADSVAEMLDLAGEDRTLEEITSLSGWSSYSQACALFEAARDVTGDPDVGLRIGEELLRQHSGTEVAALLRSLGSTGELLRNVAATGSKYSTVTRLDAARVDDWSATVTAEAIDRFARHRLLCDFTAGVLSQASVLFGMEPAVVEEVDCQTRGAERCVYEVRWEPATSTDGDLARHTEHVEAQLAALTERFESLQEMATEMVSATDVETLLGHIARRAGLAVRAPGHILAVRMPGEADLRIHANGISVDDQAQIAETLLQQDLDAVGNGVLAVEVTSARHHYGRLAALYPGGTGFFVQERRLLSAFASQAAAALDTATAMQEVSRRNDTARALLALAAELADITSGDDAASRIAAAVPDVIDCDAAAVFHWDLDTETLTMRASVGLDDSVVSMLRGGSLRAGDTPVLGRFLAGGSPFVLDENHEDPVFRELLTVSEQVAAAIVPIYASGEFFGVVTAGVRTDPERLSADDHSMERLAGLAAHGASALRNARLLDQLSHRALHDPLTGVPNRTLLRDRLNHALAQARRTHGSVGVLVVDLDGFKQVNDTHGHATGDSVIITQAQRLRTVLRPGDTVARMGGDEFAVVVPDLADAAACDTVATKLLNELHRPITIEGHTFTVSASIGAVAGSGHDSYDTLLKRADFAMYDAKRAGRNTHAVSEQEDPATTIMPSPEMTAP
ncbi:MAG: diguanylate cyclase [Acidimicrobiales bacterium]|nr:diguanylate cyclase [Acidimicrobiales bacterium]